MSYCIITHTVLCLTLTQQEQCSSPIGNNDGETATAPSRAQLFYLNTANPAPCTGNITSWRVCYYRPDTIDNNIVDLFWAIYAVYRRMGTGNSIHYVRVSGIFRAIRTNVDYTNIPGIDGEIAQGAFSCYTDALDVGTSPLSIQAGDILGTYFSTDAESTTTHAPSTPPAQAATSDITTTSPAITVTDNTTETLTATVNPSTTIALLSPQMPSSTIATSESTPTTTHLSTSSHTKGKVVVEYNNSKTYLA